MIVGHTTYNVGEMRKRKKVWEEKGEEQEKLNGEKCDVGLVFIQNPGVAVV
jgi:hypothetical protein